MSEKQRPYHVPKKEREQCAILKAVAELVKALAEAAPKLDGSCKVKKQQ